MPFQIKDFTSIAAGMINHMRGVNKKITDFQPGSVARTLIEGPAVETEELYLQMFLGLREAIPVATYLSFGFDLLPASVARGFVSITRNTPMPSPMEIPAGTVFTAADGRIYTSSAAVTWAAGENSIRVPIIATSPGLSGNIAAGLITSSPLFDAVYAINNPAITTGRDIEAPQEREARFAEFIRSLSRGTVAAVIYAVKYARLLDEDGAISEYVTRVGINEMPGYVRLYLYGSAGLASDELLEVAQRSLDGWTDENTGHKTPGYRSAGVRVDALRMVERAVPMSVRVSMFPGYALSSEVIQRLRDVYSTALAGVQPGTVLYLGDLSEMLLSVTGVRSVVPQTTENITCEAHEALVSGAFNVHPL